MKPAPERWADGPGLTLSVWRHRWLVLAAALVLGGGVYVLSSMQPAQYQSSTRLFLTAPGSTAVFTPTGRPVSLDRHVPQQARRVVSAPVLAAAAEQVEGLDADGLEQRLTVEHDEELGTLTLFVSDGDPERAAQAANALAAAYQDAVRTAQAERVERAVTELDATVASIATQVDQLETDDPTDAGAQTQVSLLTQRQVELEALARQLRVDTRLFGAGVELQEAAQPATGPFSPSPRRDAAAAGLLGALLAAAVAYWLAGRSRRLRTAAEVQQVLGVPLLGVLPLYRVRDTGTLAERVALEARVTEAYRFVAVALEGVLKELRGTSVMVTSAAPGAGKTETALQLAATARRRGREVLLVDADVRMRALTNFFRTERLAGLLDLASDPSLADREFRPFPYRIDVEHRLDLLPAGRPDAHEVPLTGDWFVPVLRRLEARYELVVLDAPPMLSVADTATLAEQVDAVLLVVREGTGSAELERARDRLQFLGRRLVGFVHLSKGALDDTNFDYGLVRARAWQLGNDRNAARPASSPVPTGERSP
ncbi:polysaccharide biosynthesis tyrosine autokinase [Egicoccus halophilus]|uniref:CobQ/CobB/MinD/ParA nucleotide binding domain-containing protein n=1 Tax=Egicoccus halophilus TaxID=1670830 RepID=A0A8J3ADL1_9ACTN|nr:tyrosine-protein kinase domain-containing protein [Egicoccus halophilus]GGI05392.1 hypothetical protein GCM10011354_13870 [Egicoccus halophilus]